MTRTEIQRRELTENERHNREMERLKKIDSVFNAASTVAGAYSAAGSFMKGAGALKQATKASGMTRTQLLKGGDTFIGKSIHYHKSKNNK